MMKFIHIGDLHLGKTICGHSMLVHQEEVLFELLDHMQQEKISLLLIAGDIYDRLVPPVEAVDLFDHFLTTAIHDYQIKILLISGNHDSDERLNFASGLLKQEGLYISSKLHKNWDTVILKDEDGEIEFHLLPYIKPSQVKELYPEEKIKTYQEALAFLVSQHPLSPNRRHVLITHQFVAGSTQVMTSDSETILSVGGSEMIDVHLFDEYDYVALGHLHAPQSISRKEVRYSGSLLRYSFDEVSQIKSICQVDLTAQGVQLQFIPLHPSLTLAKYTGYFQDFIHVSQTLVTNSLDYIAFELLDDTLIANAMDKLRTIYPNAMQLTYQQLTKAFDHQKTSASLHIDKQDDFSLFKDFYTLLRERELNLEQVEIVETLLNKVGGAK